MLEMPTHLVHVKWFLEVIHLFLGLSLGDNYQDRDVTAVAGLEGADVETSMIMRLNFLFFLLTLMPGLCSKESGKKVTVYTQILILLSLLSGFFENAPYDRIWKSGFLFLVY